MAFFSYNGYSVPDLYIIYIYILYYYIILYKTIQSIRIANIYIIDIGTSTYMYIGKYGDIY